MNDDGNPYASPGLATQDPERTPTFEQLGRVVIERYAKASETEYAAKLADGDWKLRYLEKAYRYWMNVAPPALFLAALAMFAEGLVAHGVMLLSMAACGIALRSMYESRVRDRQSQASQNQDLQDGVQQYIDASGYHIVGEKYEQHFWWQAFDGFRNDDSMVVMYFQFPLSHHPIPRRSLADMLDWDSLVRLLEVHVERV